MKKLFIVATAVVLFAACAEQKATISVPQTKLDIEALNGTIDLNQDITGYNISDVRLLRNAFAARQGYCFMNADLRGIYSTTSWYDSLVNIRFCAEEEEIDENGVKHEGTKIKPISYTKEEQAFMDKLKAREDELLKKNFDAGKGLAVNIENLINPFQINEMNDQLAKNLATYGFAIVTQNEDQLFHIYERNDYHNFPSFVTTDLYLQTFHIYFDCVLKKVEQEKFIPVLTDYTQNLYQAMRSQAATASNPEVKAAAEYCQTYFAIAWSLFTGKPLPSVPAQYKAMAEQEITNVENAETCPSEFLDYTSTPFVYNIYRPRGHYTRNDQLKRYFKGMMWLQNVPFGTDKPKQLKAALLIAKTIGDNDHFTKIYNTINEPITFLMGQPDNINILQVNDLLKQNGANLEQALTDAATLGKLREAIEAKDKEQTRIKPKFTNSSEFKINFMPQRYMPDAEVLQEMVDYDSKPTKRDVPKGLDVMAAIGITAAERILIDELKENKAWDGYSPMLTKMKEQMGKTDWNASVANRWIAAMKEVNAKPEKAPYFMNTPQWDKKTLNSALASWAELKHDAILYAKQPMGAECGGGGLPEPVCRGYVEPNVAYWQKAIELLDATANLLKKYDFMTETVQSITDDLHEKAEFLLTISQKELKGEKLTDEEYSQIEYIGASFESTTLNLLREPNQMLMGWDDVQGTDKKMAVVADVYTANSFNNPNKSVLYEAVGPAYEIYVIVEIEGYLYLTRGAVFSYREFKDALEKPRMTDEEWQKKLEEKPHMGIPDWMEEIIVPIDGKPLDNEHIFYSSGC